MLREFGDISEALDAYNWGDTHVRAAMAKYGADWLAQAPGETQSYVAKILNNLGSKYSVSVDPAPAAPDPASRFRAGVTAELPASGPSFTTMALLAALGIFALWVFDEARA